MKMLDGNVARASRPCLSTSARARRPCYVIAFVLMLSMCATFVGAAPNDLRIWYSKPAAAWDEALPIGSGRLGAMVFGGTESERIQFNEDTLWTGKPHDYDRAGAGDVL